MKLLFSSMFLYEYSTDMIRKAAELAGYDGVEFWIETPHFFVDKDVSKLDCFKDVELAVHSPVIDLNPVSVNKKVADITLSEVLESVAIAKKVNAPVVTVHAGKRSAVREPVWADYLGLQRFLRILGRYGKVKGVTVSLENSEYGINMLCKKADETYNFVVEYDLAFTFDVKHALRNGEAEKFIDLLYDRIVNVHVSFYDSKNRHVSSIGSKEVAKILNMLSELGYDGIITVELDDLGMGRMDFGAKVETLRREGNYIRSFFKS